MATASDLNQLYLAYFGRPADAGGLAFYANASLDQVAATFAASAESLALYGGGTFGTAQITQIYTTLFNRAPEAAGIAAWQAQLTAGSLSATTLALAILRGAQNDDKAAVANKLAFTAQWTSTLQAQAEAAGLTPAKAYALSLSLMAGVGASPASLANILAAAPSAITTASGGGSSAPPVGQSFTLISGAETITGGGGDDTISGFAVNNLGTESAAATFNAALDTINGGAGTDTLALSTSGTTPNITISPTRVTSVERLSVTATSTGVTTVTLAPTSSFTELVSAANTGSTTFTGYGNTVTKIGVTGQTTGTLRFTADGSTLAGTQDALTLTLSGDGTNTSGSITNATINLTPSGGTNTDFYETLNIVSAGSANYVQLATGTNQTALATINISGSAPLQLVFPNTDKARLATTIDASATTGGVAVGGGTANSGLGVANQTVKLGSGNDTVNFGANLDANDTVDGGGGTDSLGVSSNVTSAALAHVSNMEVFLLIPNGAQAQDLSQLAGHGFTSIGFGNPNSGSDITLTNMPSDGSLPLVVNSALNASYNINVSLATPGGSADAITLRMAATATTGTAANFNTLSNITGLETLNIVSGGTGTQNSIFNDQVLAQHVITGSTNLSIVASNAAGNMVVDATAFTGKLDFSGPTDTTTGYGVTALLGSGVSNISGGYGSNLITLSAQGSNAAIGLDTMNLRNTAVANTVRMASNNAAGNGAATDDHTPGVLATYFIDASSVLTNLTLVLSANDNDFALKNAAGTLSTGLAKGSVAKALAIGDTPVTQNVAQSSGAAAATASVTHIALTTATTFSTDVKGTFAAALGSGSVTGLAADANYLVSVYDSTNSKTLYAVVNTGASAAGDTTLSAADFTDSGVAVIGMVHTSALGTGMLGVAY